MTSEQVGGVWPLIAGDGLPSTGAQLGIDFLSGGAFHVDPIGWTLRGTAGLSCLCGCNCSRLHARAIGARDHRV